MNHKAVLGVGTKRSSVRYTNKICTASGRYAEMQLAKTAPSSNQGEIKRLVDYSAQIAPPEHCAAGSHH